MSYSSPAGSPVVCDATRTAALLDFPGLVRALRSVAVDVDQGRVASPARLVVPLGEGAVMLCMPAAAADIGIHKLVTIQPANAARGLPTIHGTVSVCDAATARILCTLDGPEVTGRRTAAVTLLAIESLRPRPPTQVLLIGAGGQARHHLQALHDVHPACRVWVRGSGPDSTRRFVDAARSIHADTVACPATIPVDVEVVVTLTTSRVPVYDEPATAGRLVVGVGAFKPEMAEIGDVTLHRSDIYADDPAGARHEAGDLMRAGVDWTRVRSLGSLVQDKVDPSRPAVFKSVGTAAWDLAAARVALQGL